MSPGDIVWTPRGTGRIIAILTEPSTALGGWVDRGQPYAIVELADGTRTAYYLDQLTER